MQPSLLVLALGALVAGHASGAAAMQEVRAVPPLSLQIVHLNDFHARFEPVSVKAGSCKVADECIGGLPRVAAAIAAERQRNPEALVLNGGDNFQGTLWYSLFRWNATAHFMNQIPWDALTVGNHEFDHGVAGLTPFMQHFKVAPIVVANMDDSQEPSMAGLWRPSVVVQKGGHKIGIVGYIWKETPSIARTEKLVFTDELAALDAEAGRLKREEDVDVVIALTHAGVEVDLAVAEGSQYADVIVGAHSHTLLYTGSPPAGDSAYGPYPLVVKQASGRTVLVVQAAAYTKYLGNLTVHFDDAGEVAAWEGNPIYMGHDLPEDEAMAREMVPWGDEVAEQGLKVVGSSAVELDKTTYNCYSSECSLGNFVTDAMVDHYVGKGPAGSWTAAAVAFMNAGGLRTNIPPGDVTYGDLVAAQPFENTMDLIELQGKHLLELLEDSVDTLSLLHWSGLRVVFDYDLPVRKRVVSSELLCADCEVPTYEPIDAERWYTVVAPSFIIEGGDNFQTVKNNFRNRIIGPVDMELFLEHLKTHSPLVTEMDGRLTVLRSARHGRWRRSVAATKTLFY